MRKCPGEKCGLIWLDPAPCKDDLGKAYAIYYTHQDASIPPATSIKKAYHFVRDCYLSLKYGYFAGMRQARFKYIGLLLYLFPGRRADEDFNVMYLPARPNGHLLELGCGSGRMLGFMSSLGWNAEGIDVDPSAVDNAQAKGLKVSLGSLKQQNYPENSFDAVMMSHVIEHVSDPAEVFAECYRVLKPGGVLSIVTPNVESLGLRYFGHSWLHLDPPRHLILYNCKALHALAREAGLSDIRARTTIRDAHSLFWASYSIRKNAHFTMGSQPGRAVKLLMLLLRLVEWGVIVLYPRGGEEISMIGIKK
ncbi:MAG: class I SAM-dependent methyltransferase [Nitrospirota bacterium]